MDKEARTCCSRRSGSFWYQFSAIEGSNPCFFAKASKYSRQLLASLQCLVGYLGSEMGKKIFSNGFLPPLFPTPFTTDAIREGERGGGGSITWLHLCEIEFRESVLKGILKCAIILQQRATVIVDQSSWYLRPIGSYERIESPLLCKFTKEFPPSWYFLPMSLWHIFAFGSDTRY